MNKELDILIRGLAGVQFTAQRLKDEYPRISDLYFQLWDFALISSAIDRGDDIHPEDMERYEREKS